MMFHDSSVNETTSPPNGAAFVSSLAITPCPLTDGKRNVGLALIPHHPMGKPCLSQSPVRPARMNLENET